MQCPKCNKGQLFRGKRHGWIERQLFGRLGLYPWRCSYCKERSLLKVREETNEKPSPIWTG
jgi:DNA-directed RNA polymerase subunit RPC12/RpoP